MGKSFSDVRTYNQDKGAREDEIVRVLDWGKAKKKWIRLRFLDTSKTPFVAIGKVWVDKEITKGDVVKEISYPRLPVGWDPVEGEFTGKEKDPYIEAGCRLSKHFFVNAIVRAVQDKNKRDFARARKTKNEQKTGFCDDLESQDKTPVMAVRLPAAAVAKLGKLKQLNKAKVTNKKTGKVKEEEFDVSHERYGRDVEIYFDPDEQAANMYNIQLAPDRTPMTDEEKSYLAWDLVTMAKENFVSPQSRKEALADAKADGIVGGPKKDDYYDDKEEDEEEDDVDLGKSKSKKKKDKPKSNKKSKAKEEEEESDLDGNEDEEEDEPKTKKSSKSSGKKEKKGKSKKDDEDFPF